MASRTITLGSWTFYLEEGPDGLTLSVPDCGGMADSLPRVPEQLAWAERELAAVPGLVQIWPTAWRVPPDALEPLTALFVRHGAATRASSRQGDPARPDPIRLAGAPRSIAEIDFVAGMWPCELCSTWGMTSRIGHGGGVWRVRARCTRCGAERGYELPFEHDLNDDEPPEELELGGPEPSQVLEPYALEREIDRLVPTIAAAPEELAEPAWSVNEAAVERLRTALVDVCVPAIR